MSRRRADETCGTPTMFDVDPTTDSLGEAARAKAPKSELHGACPTCNRRGKRNEQVNTGLIRQGPHLVWRPHNITTWKGTKIPCRASGVAVCVAPDRDRIIDCPCAQEAGAA